MRAAAAELVYGLNSVLAALRAKRRTVRRLWLAEGRTRDRRLDELLGLAAEAKITVEMAGREALDRLAGGGLHQGVVAEAEIGVDVRLEEVVEASAGPALLVILDRVQDPRNLGAVVRTAAAAGATAVVVGASRQAPMSAAALKVAEGGAEFVPVVQVGNVHQALRRIKQLGIWVVGLHPDAERGWDEADLTLPTAIVLGSEGPGLKRVLKDNCDLLVALPTAPGVDSLNVSAAAAVALYEAVRQRRRKLRGADSVRST